MKLGSALSGAFKTYAKKPLLFSGIYVLVTLAVLVINILITTAGAGSLLMTAMFNGDWLTLLSLGGFLVIISIVVSVIAGVLNLGGLIKAVSDTVGGHKTSIMECIKFAFSKIKDYIILFFHIFWYSLAWVMILLMLLTPVLLNVLGGGSDAVGQNPIAYAQDFDSAELAEFEAMFEDLAGEEFGGFESYASFGGPTMNLPLPLVIVYLVLFIFIIYRTLRSIFSYYALFDDKSLTPKKALEKSKAATKGKIWRLIGYLIVYGIVIGILAGIVGAVLLTPLTKAFAGNSFEAYAVWNSIFQFVLAAVIAPITIIYYYLVYKGFSKEHTN